MLDVSKSTDDDIVFAVSCDTVLRESFTSGICKSPFGDVSNFLEMEEVLLITACRNKGETFNTTKCVDENGQIMFLVSDAEMCYELGGKYDAAKERGESCSYASIGFDPGTELIPFY